MATNTKTYTIDIDKKIQIGGKLCNNYSIVPQKPECANIVCELIKDSKENITAIKIQVPEECADGCVDFIIECKDNCDGCGQQRLRICPCTENSDCPDCEICGPSGYCVSKCDPNEFCSGDRCVECDDENPCHGGKICVAGECKCPPSKPYQNEKGECVECNDITPLLPCEDCVGGKIVDKECAEGVCDNDSGDCVECVKGSDCNVPFEKCKDKKCECIDGYKRNIITGDCEPKSDCTRDEDCGKCRKCLADGKCGDYECPHGYVPSNVPGECCVKLCDCNNPSCPPGYKCINLDGTRCFCQNCNIKCSNGTCPEGCDCNEANNNCEPDECSGKCDPNNPCPPGCGCDDNGDCVKCSKLNCAECEKVKGCNCTTPNNCESSPCSGPCDPNNPCAPGCGCDDDRMCIDCNKVSCSKSDDCPMNCDCDEDSGKCSKNPCQNIDCETHADCGKNCICGDNGKCKKGIPPTDTGCKDTAQIIDNGNCTIKAVQTTDYCCSCKDIYLNINQTVNPSSRNITSTLLDTNGTLLSGTGIVNDDEISGTIRYSWEQIAREVNSSGNVIAGGNEISISKTANTIFSNSDTSNVTVSMDSNGSIVTISGKNYKIIETTLYAETIGLLVHKNNKCTYKLGRTIIYRKSQTDAGSYKILLSNVDNCKTPVFVWYKSMDGIIWTEIKRVYSTKTGTNKYEDILEKKDGLEICKYFKFESDCGCLKDAKYSCNGSGLTRYVPIQPIALDVTHNDACGNVIYIKEVQLCDLFIGATIPFKLYINGELHGEFIADNNGILFNGGLEITKNFIIKDVVLEYPCDDCNRNLIIKLPNLSADCETCTDSLMTLNVSGDCSTGLFILGNISKKSNPVIKIAGCKVEIYINGNFISNAVTDVNGDFTLNAPVTSNGIYNIKAINCFGCEKTTTISISDCCSANINGITYHCNTNILTSSVSGCAIPATLKIFKDGLEIWSGSYSNSISLPFALQNGEYSVILECSGGCNSSKQFIVSCGQPIFNAVASCIGLDGIITVSGYSGGSGAPYLVEYSIDNFASILGTGTTDPFVINTVPGNTYNIRIKDASGNYSQVKNVNSIDCSVNSFGFSTRMKCFNSVQQFCITPTITGIAQIIVKDFNGVIVYSGNISLQSGVETCNYFQVVPSIGAGSVDITYNGNTVSEPITITACNNVLIDYNCVSGLSVSGVTSFNVHSSGYPSSGYGPYASGDTDLFFTDGINGSRVLTIKSPDGSETYGSVTIDCCVHSVAITDEICNGGNPRMKVHISGNTGTYRVSIYKGVNQVCSPEIIAHTTYTASYSIPCNLENNTNYSVEVENIDYENRIYKDQSVGNVTCSVTVSYTSTNCGNNGGNNLCPLTSSDFNITGGCTPTVTNNSSYSVNAQFVSREGPGCSGFTINESVVKTINAGQTVGFVTLGHQTLPKELVITYLSGSGDACQLRICYSGCSGVGSCSLTDDPAASCSSQGAQPGNRRLTVLNNNSVDVFIKVDGVTVGYLIPGASYIGYFGANSSHTITFVCVDDQSQTRTITYTLSC